MMDAPDKFPGYTHIALRVASIPATIAALKANDIPITQGPAALAKSLDNVTIRVAHQHRDVTDTVSIAERACGSGGFRVEPLRSWA